ncbi:AN1-type zinc finger protein 1 (Zinc finger AN1-type-containing protein 1) [Durusdinium trenchii]|uniref:AN1-type zinc finger protein 1 (Zinc finger AN1-type-containing protein 1) n=1 Tax=Durusdinium trenchii TaxID=1381693 RepID=A0ABP0Q294_9DINO
MAAFSDVGAVCSVPSCGQQDFLPTTCFACKRPFCKDHYRAELHGCEASSESVLLEVPSPKRTSGASCAAPGCKEQISVHNGLQCARCGQVVCVHHRFEDQHPCVDLEAAVKKALAEAQSSLRPEEFSEAVRTLTKIFDNILSQPKNAKFRSLRKENAVVKEKLKHPSCLASLRLCGFVEDADVFVCPDSVDLSTMRRVCTQLKLDHDDQWAHQERHKGHPGDQEAVPLSEGVRLVDGVIVRPPKVEAQGAPVQSRGYSDISSRSAPAGGGKQRPTKSAFDFQRRERNTQQAQMDDLQELRRQRKEQYQAGPKSEGGRGPAVPRPQAPAPSSAPQPSSADGCCLQQLGWLGQMTMDGLDGAVIVQSTCHRPKVSDTTYHDPSVCVWGRLSCGSKACSLEADEDTSSEEYDHSRDDLLTSLAQKRAHVDQVEDDNYVREHGRHQVLGRIANGILLFILGSLIQIVLVGLLFLFSEERMQDPYEILGTRTLAEDAVLVCAFLALRGFVHGPECEAQQDLYDAMEKNEKLPESNAAVGLCLKDHSVPWSQSMVTFVWLCKCTPAIVNAAAGSLVIASMPRVGTITINSKQGKLQICSLPLIAKLITIFMVQLPLLAIDLLLALVGMKFLMYCNALGKLIVKAISLSFIETVSGVVFDGLASKAFQSEVKRTSVVAISGKGPMHLESWFSGLLRIIFIVGVTLWYCRMKHGGLQDFRLACFQYKYQFIFPDCGYCGLDFFGIHLAN